MGDAHEHRGTVRTPPRSQGVQHTATWSAVGNLGVLEHLECSH